MRFAFIDAYRYSHDSRERFVGGCLAGLEASTDDNGKAWKVAGRRVDGVTTIQTNEQSFTSADCMLTFAYWDPAMLERSRLLNAQTGAYVDVKIAPLGSVTLDTTEGPKPALRYQLTGPDLHIDLWYTTGREWIGLESRTSGGRVIRYVPR